MPRTSFRFRLRLHPFPRWAVASRQERQTFGFETEAGLTTTSRVPANVGPRILEIADADSASHLVGKHKALVSDDPGCRIPSMPQRRPTRRPLGRRCQFLSGTVFVIAPGARGTASSHPRKPTPAQTDISSWREATPRGAPWGFVEKLLPPRWMRTRVRQQLPQTLPPPPPHTMPTRGQSGPHLSVTRSSYCAAETAARDGFSSIGSTNPARSTRRVRRPFTLLKNIRLVDRERKLGGRGRKYLARVEDRYVTTRMVALANGAVRLHVETAHHRDQWKRFWPVTVYVTIAALRTSSIDQNHFVELWW
jgi:hypothetical protein